jgi:hypothetical protein
MVNLEWCNCPGLHGTYLLVQLQKPFPTWHHGFWSRDVKRINTNGLLGAKLVCSRSQDNIGSSIGMKRLEIRGAFARQQLNQLQLAAIEIRCHTSSRLPGNPFENWRKGL